MDDKDKDDKVIDEWQDWLIIAVAIFALAIVMGLMVLFDVRF